MRRPLSEADNCCAGCGLAPWLPQPRSIHLAPGVQRVPAGSAARKRLGLKRLAYHRNVSL